jgi:sigma-E factor negative regulatory protein RseA
MNEELNQHISQLLDDELDGKVALNLLQKMQANPDLKGTMNRYAAIGHTLKTNGFLLAKADFSETIAQQIDREVTYLLPQRKPAKHAYKRVVLAASIAVVAVLASRSMDNSLVSPIQATSPLQVAQQTPAKTAAPVVATITTQPDPYPLNARISDYLQAHNNSVYTPVYPDVIPLAKVTAYNQK